jgi:CRP-like cAMP-binding protein
MSRRADYHSEVLQTTSFFDVLRGYLLARGTFSDEQLDFIRSQFICRSLRAREYLLRAGAVPTHSAFVVRGCLRTYVIDQEGREHIVNFGPETWWVGDTTSLASGTPSQYYIDAVEDSDLLLIDGPSHERIVQGVPGYATAFRVGLARHAAAKDRRILSAISASARDRYEDFLHTYPSLATRVPQHMLAAYLGVSPETISRIRRKLAGR